MKILNFGSLNIDYVFQVEHFIMPGETESSRDFKQFPGGKGLNTSAALAKAGAKVYHAGRIGTDGLWLKELLDSYGVNTDYIETDDLTTGKAMIQVDKSGQNGILLYAGANFSMTEAFIDRVLENFESGDILVLQNEINCVDKIIEKGWTKGMKIALNPSPFNEHIKAYDLSHVTWLMMNEIEGEALSGCLSAEEMAGLMLQKYPQLKVILTLGEKGALYMDKERKIIQEAYRVRAVDTTAAGDTFTGYFLKCAADGKDEKTALLWASSAAAMAVTRQGAAVSVPSWEELKKSPLCPNPAESGEKN